MLHMDLSNESHSSVRCPSFLCDINFDFGHYEQIFHLNCFVPVKSIGASDRYLFVPRFVKLALAGGHKVSGKQNVLA